MGLLDFFATSPDDPRYATNMGLFSGLAHGDVAGGILAAQDGLLKRKLTQAQLDNFHSEIETRKASIAKQQQMQDMLKTMFGGGASVDPTGQANTPGMTAPPSGLPGTSPAAGGQAGTSGAPMGSRIASMNPDALAMLKANGLDLVDVAKLARPDWKVDNGYRWNANDPSANAGFMPFLKAADNGQVTMGQAGPDGRMIVGAPTGAMDTYKGYKQIDANVTAGSDLVDAYDPVQQRNVKVTRAQAIQAASGGAAPQPASAALPQPGRPSMGMPPAQPGVNGSFAGDPSQIMESIIGIKDPQERANAMAAFTEQARRSPQFAAGGPLAAGPSTAETIRAATDKERAVETAKADVGRDTGRLADAKRYGQMREGVGRAVDLLKQGPTASGFGSALDAGANFVGMSTKGADVASQLDTLSGWLTANVPRMEGPQSDKDVANYRIMAGTVGDRTKPVSQRLAAAQELQGLQDKYAGLNGYGGGSPQVGQPAQQSKSNVVDALPKMAPKGARARDTQTGAVMVFNGLSWVPEK